MARTKKEILDYIEFTDLKTGKMHKLPTLDKVRDIIDSTGYNNYLADVYDLQIEFYHSNAKQNGTDITHSFVSSGIYRDAILKYFRKHNIGKNILLFKELNNFDNEYTTFSHLKSSLKSFEFKIAYEFDFRDKRVTVTLPSLDLYDSIKHFQKAIKLIETHKMSLTEIKNYRNKFNRMIISKGISIKSNVDLDGNSLLCL